MTRLILVGYDGSDGSQAALERGIDDVRASGGRLVVIAVAEPPLVAAGPMSVGPLGEGLVTALPQAEPPEASHLLAAARERVEAAGVDADYVWRAGEPAAAIVGEARELGADAVVVGKGHHSRLGRWLGTDVAAEIEKAAGCEVIVVEPEAGD